MVFLKLNLLAGSTYFIKPDGILGFYITDSVYKDSQGNIYSDVRFDTIYGSFNFLIQGDASKAEKTITQLLKADFKDVKAFGLRESLEVFEEE